MCKGSNIHHMLYLGAGLSISMQSLSELKEMPSAPTGTRAPPRTSEGMHGEGAKNKEGAVCSHFH